jgi:hypothetical protein
MTVSVLYSDTARSLAKPTTTNRGEGDLGLTQLVIHVCP